MIQLSPEFIEKYRVNLRSVSECDMERTFQGVKQLKLKKRLKATFGLSEVERTFEEIWGEFGFPVTLTKKHSNTKLKQQL